MLSLAPASLAFAPSAVPAAPVATRAVAPVMETVSDLKTLAGKLNPSIGYWCATAAAPPAAPLELTHARPDGGPLLNVAAAVISSLTSLGSSSCAHSLEKRARAPHAAEQCC